MFSFEELCQLVRVVAETRVGAIEIERDGMRVRIDGIPTPTTTVAAGATLLPPHVVAGGAPFAGATPGLSVGEARPAGSPPVLENEDGLSFVTSPIVGTFYRAPNPDAEPYVKVGDHVTKGQTLCIVEAMKLMNEIEADVSGTIVRVLPENAQPVEFGQRLFAIRPA
jgi:acetyl-CoA carboxylase biotin carboxyl carrier protein